MKKTVFVVLAILMLAGTIRAYGWEGWEWWLEPDEEETCPSLEDLQKEQDRRDEEREQENRRRERWENSRRERRRYFDFD